MNKKKGEEERIREKKKKINGAKIGKREKKGLGQ